MPCIIRGCPKCRGTLIEDGKFWQCLQCGYEILKVIKREESVIYFQITEANGKLEALKTKLKLGLAWVRETGQEVYVGIGATHQNWLMDTLKDYSAKGVPVDKEVIRGKFSKEGIAKVEEYFAPCGHGPFFDKMLLSGHQRTCMKCLEIKQQQPPKLVKHRKPRMEVSVQKVLPAMSLTVDDLLTKLKEERETHLKIATELDAVCAALLAYQQSEADRRKALEQSELAKNSIKMILKKLDLNND